LSFDFIACSLSSLISLIDTTLNRSISRIFN
jgi:hypothetical protein